MIPNSLLEGYHENANQTTPYADDNFPVTKIGLPKPELITYSDTMRIKAKPSYWLLKH